MIDVATGKARIEETNNQYQSIYNELDSLYQSNQVKNPNPYTDLWEFHHYWKEKLPQYSDRRAYVIKLYKKASSKAEMSIDFWAVIHPAIRSVSKSRFESNHFADSVEAALKEVNVRVKNVFITLTGQEEDGASLMKKAFSVNRPVIQLDDIGNETGRNIQQGYMELFSGSMIGIRNPKAHANIDITKERAIHFLFLASLLMCKLD